MQDVHADGTTTFVHVPGKNPRTVPVLPSLAPYLRQAVENAPGDERVVFPSHDNEESRYRALDKFINRATPIRPHPTRLRSYWIVTLAPTMPVRNLLEVAGLERPNSLEPWMQWLPKLDLAGLVELTAAADRASR